MVIEEADEAGFWLEFLLEIESVKPDAVAALRKEANEIVAIFTASKKTISARMNREKVRCKKRTSERSEF